MKEIADQDIVIKILMTMVGYTLMERRRYRKRLMRIIRRKMM